MTEKENKNQGKDEMGVHQSDIHTHTSEPLSPALSDVIPDSGISEVPDVDWGQGDRVLGAGEYEEDRLESNNPDDVKLAERVKTIEKYEAARVLLISGMDYTEVSKLVGIPRHKARYLSNGVDRELGLLDTKKMKEILTINFYVLFSNRAMYQQEYLKALFKAKEKDDTKMVLSIIDKMQAADKSFAWITNQVGVAALYKATGDGKGGKDAPIKETLKGLRATKRRLLRPRHRNPMPGDSMAEILNEQGE